MTLLPYFFNIAFAVALEKVEEWVCACRKAVSRPSAEAVGFGSPDRRRKETTAFGCRPSAGFAKRSAACRTKAVLTQKYRLYYRQNSRGCQLKRIV